MRKIFIGLIIGLFFIVPVNVFAESINIKCDKTEMSASETLSCELSTESSSMTYNKIEATVDVSNASSITFNSKEGFSGNITDKKLTINSSSAIGSATIGTIQIKFDSSATSNNSIKISDIKLYNDSEEVGTVNNIEESVKVKSTVNTIESLNVSECDGCKISPSFKKNITVYTVTTQSDQIKISAQASGNATISGTGLKKLTKDKETFTLKVTSEAGTTKKYKVIVSKNESLSSDASLKSITLSKGSLTPKFSSDVTNYTVVLDSDKVTISAEKSDSKATVMGIGEKKLEYGRNEFTIIVAAEDGTTKSYLININRPDTRNANAYLKELTINGKDIEFEKDIVEYTYNIDQDVDKLDIEAIPELETSTVEIEGNENFELGENIVTITVKAEDDSKKVYKIIVIKGAKSNSNIYLDELKIAGYDIAFDKELFEYTITIKDEKELDIITFSEAGYDTEIVGNKELKDGSIVKVIVSDEDGNNNIYKIRIRVNNTASLDSSPDDINYIPVIMISLLVVLFITDTILLIKRRKNK